MKIILSLAVSLMIIAGIMGCSTISNNANLRNTNTNTGYMANNANMTTNMPTANMSNNMMNTSSNNGSHVNSNMKSNMNSGMQSKPGSNTNMKGNGNHN